MTRAASADDSPSLGWLGIVRLGLVQASLGAVVVIATSTMNRVMTIELALPAVVPGALVALHHFVQVLRPRWGWGSDVGGRRTPWIVGGMGLMAASLVLAAASLDLMAHSVALGLTLAVLCFLLIGMGVGAAGTSLLVLLAKRTRPDQRAPAASVVWLMMIAGIAVTATVAGRLLQPFSFDRLFVVAVGVAAFTMVLTVVAVWRVESPAATTVARPAAAVDAGGTTFRQAVAQVWAESQSRRFAAFVFVSMLAYSAQELLLEPFAGSVFALTPGQSTGLSGLLHAGVLVGMLAVAVGGAVLGRRNGSLRLWTIGGCLGSAAAVILLALTGMWDSIGALKAAVFVLGTANGMFAVAAIGSMMQLAGTGRGSREGVRMGLWGAAQAVAFGMGGLVGTSASDLARLLLGSPVAAYGAVFAGEAALFVVAAWLAARVYAGAPRAVPGSIPVTPVVASPGRA